MGKNSGDALWPYRKRCLGISPGLSSKNESIQEAGIYYSLLNWANGQENLRVWNYSL